MRNQGRRAIADGSQAVWTNTAMKLYSYFRSSAAYRVRIALNLKGLQYDTEAVHLLKDGGQQHSASYRERSPLGTVPCLETDEGGHLTQSLAIIEYLEETSPETPLLPVGPPRKSGVRKVARMLSRMSDGAVMAACCGKCGAFYPRL